MNYTTGTKVFGDWEIVKTIGKGSYGEVYEIHKTNYGITVRSALKVIRIPQSTADIKAALNDGMDERSVTTYFQGFVDEIVREIAVMSSLKGHLNIVGYEDHCVLNHADEIGWDILIRMELLTSLQDYLLTTKLKEWDVIQLAKDICSALAFCQKKGMIHRDVKPENIFVNEGGRFKLGDFGVARTVEKTTGGLSKKGTESYMAPEVYLGKPYGSTVDIYSLGLMLYKFTNNNRLPLFPPAPQPITFADRENALLRRMKGETLPPPIKAQPEFADVILKACAYDPEDRYRTAADMLEDLDGLGVQPHTAASPKSEKSPLPYEPTVGMWAMNTNKTDEQTALDTPKSSNKPQTAEKISPNTSNEPKSPEKEIQENATDEGSVSDAKQSEDTKRKTFAGKFVIKHKTIWIGCAAIIFSFAAIFLCVRGVSLIRYYTALSSIKSLTEEGCYEDAETAYRNAVEIVTKGLNSNTKLTDKALKKLIRCYLMGNEPDRAISFLDNLSYEDSDLEVNYDLKEYLLYSCHLQAIYDLLSTDNYKKVRNLFITYPNTLIPDFNITSAQGADLSQECAILYQNGEWIEILPVGTFTRHNTRRTVTIENSPTHLNGKIDFSKPVLYIKLTGNDNHAFYWGLISSEKVTDGNDKIYANGAGTFFCCNDSSYYPDEYLYARGDWNSNLLNGTAALEINIGLYPTQSYRYYCDVENNTLQGDIHWTMKEYESFIELESISIDSDMELESVSIDSDMGIYFQTVFDSATNILD